jgi:hypothetical protein
MEDDASCHRQSEIMYLRDLLTPRRPSAGRLTSLVEPTLTPDGLALNR